MPALPGGGVPVAEVPRTSPVSEPATDRATATTGASNTASSRATDTAPPPPASTLPPAAAKLLEQAEHQRQARDYVTTAATLERALGIKPRAPEIWNRLARVRMEQGHHAQAANLAARSNALAGTEQAALKQDNQAIITKARQAAGGTAGAAQAQ